MSGSGRAVSRILSAPPCLHAGGENHLSEQPVPETRPACAGLEAGHFRVSYLALLPMGFSVPRRLLFERWALTPPFHPCRRHTVFSGGMFSVALSVEKPSPALLPRLSHPHEHELRGIAPCGVRTFLPDHALARPKRFSALPKPAKRYRNPVGKTRLHPHESREST